MRKYLIILVLLILISSCKLIYHTAPRYLKNYGFTHRYTDSASGLESKLNINGYFTINDTLNSGTTYGRYTNMIFFRDGMFVSRFHNCCDTNTKHIGKVIPMYLDSINKQRKNGNRVYGFYEGFIWGYYKVNGDTIKVQHIDRPLLGESHSFWYAYEIWFKIVDRNTIKEIYIYPIHKSTDSDISNFKHYKKSWIPVKAYFRPINEIPKSDGWLKYEDWFWENESRYNNWIIETNK